MSCTGTFRGKGVKSSKSQPREFLGVCLKVQRYV